MRKVKCYYNPTTCSYERISTSILAIILRIFFFLSFSTMLGVATMKYCQFQGHFVSPREAELLQHNEQLKSYYHVVQQKIEHSAALLSALQEQDNTIYRVLLNVAPLSPTELNAGIGGFNKYAHLEKDGLIVQTLSKVDQLANQLKIQKKSFDQMLLLAQKNASRFRSMPSLPPISKKYLKRISSMFGRRIHPMHKILMMHNGVDFAAPMHSPIYAAADGYIKWIKCEKKGFGKHLLIEHGNGFQTHYAHMHTVMVRDRQNIVKGQQIGTVGDTGSVTAPHLHYEVYCNGRHVDPVQYFVCELTPEEYEAIRKLAAYHTQTLCY